MPGKSLESVILDATRATTTTPLLWDFHCRCEKRVDGKYVVRITGSLSGEVRESTGHHPLWELIRLIGLESPHAD